MASFNPEILVSLQRNISKVRTDLTQQNNLVEDLDSKVNHMLAEANESFKTLTSEGSNLNVTETSVLINLLRR